MSYKELEILRTYLNKKINNCYVGDCYQQGKVVAYEDCLKQLDSIVTSEESEENMTVREMNKKIRNFCEKQDCCLDCELNDLKENEKCLSDLDVDRSKARCDKIDELKLPKIKENQETNNFTVRKLIETLRFGVKVELREDDNNIIVFESDSYKYVKDEILDKQVYDWGVINVYKIYINFKSEESEIENE